MAVTTFYTTEMHHDKWVFTLTANNDVVNFTPNHSMRGMTIQVEGTFSAGTLALQGSNDGTTFYALPTAVSLTAAGVKSVAQLDLAYDVFRVTVTGATTPSLTVTVHALRNT